MVEFNDIIFHTINFVETKFKGKDFYRVDRKHIEPC